MSAEASPPILHVDMDAFFASVELLAHPELMGKPVIVGGRSARAVVTSATYEARAFGVHSAMPVGAALRLCPKAVVLEPHMQLYRDYSRQVMALFREVTPLVEPLSIDEAFLDVAGARRLLGESDVIAQNLRARVLAETGLPCSVGVAPTKFMAKLASGRAKPDGMVVIRPSEVLGYLHPLPVRALWGVGGKTAEQLERLGLRTVGDIAATPLDALVRSVGEATGTKLHELANGIDPRGIVTATQEKSVGHERTFDVDERSPEVLRRELLHQSNRVAVRLRAAGLVGRTVALKLRFADFTTISRSRTLTEPTDLGKRIYDEVTAIYDAVGVRVGDGVAVGRAGAAGNGGAGVGLAGAAGNSGAAASGGGASGEAIRLIGVRVEQLSEADGAVHQPALWADDDAPSEGWREAERTVDRVTARFGLDSVRPASLVHAPRTGETADRNGTRR